MLEGPDLLKSNFDTVEARIVEARKLVMLPADFVAEDDSRTATACGVETTGPIRDHFWLYLRTAAERFAPVSTLNHYPVNVPVMVEKLDLMGLFRPVVDDYRVPMFCGRGQTDGLSRIEVLKRTAAAWGNYGKRTTMLMFGDHDVGGLSITDGFKRTLGDWLPGSGCPEETLVHIDCVRAGLNIEDITRLDLTWIDGLHTGSKGEVTDLNDPNHKQHFHANVQAYLRAVGAQKVEANALLGNVAQGRDILRRQLQGLVSDWARGDYANAMREARDEARGQAEALAKFLRQRKALARSPPPPASPRCCRPAAAARVPSCAQSAAGG